VARKAPKVEVRYRPAVPLTGRRCATCTMFRPPAGCTAVRGHIFARGDCDLYKARK
jgi:hypothetical protein